MSLTVGELVGYMDIDDTKFNAKLGEGEQKFGKFGGAATKAVGGAMTAAGLAVVGFAAKGTADMVGFQGQMNEVFTLLPGISQQAMGDMTGQVKDFSKEFGVLPNEAVPALYQAISAGVPSDNVFSFLETAQMAAVGGVTDLTTAVDGITTVVNAYGADVVSAGEASDLMFTAVKLGKTSFEELSASLYNVTPIASSLGVGFGDVTAAMAAMTAQGIPTNVASTQMRQLFVELSKEGSKTSDTFKEVAGVGFKEFIAGGGDVQQALQLLEEYAADSGVSINDLFGSVEAGSAALALTGGGTEAFSKALEEMGGAAGATETAYNTMDEGVGRSIEKMKAKFAVLAISIGEKVLPAIEKLVDWVSKAIDWFSQLPSGLQTAITIFGALGAVLGPIILLLPKMAAGIKMVSGVMRAVMSANPYVLGLMAIIAVVILVIKYHDEIKAALVAAWDAIKGALTTAWDAIKGAFSAAWDFIKDTANTIWEFLKEWGALIVYAVMPVIGLPLLIWQHWETIKEFFLTLWDGIQEVWSEVWGAITDFFVGIYESIKGAFSKAGEEILQPFITAYDAVIGFFTDTVGPGIAKFFSETLPNFVTEALSKIYEWIVQPFVDMWTGSLQPWFTETWAAIRTFFTDTLPANISAGLSQLYAWIVQPFVDMWTGSLQPWFTETWDKIKTFFTDTLPSNISAGLSQLWDWITSPFIDTWENHLHPWFTETWQKIKNFFADIPGYVTDGLSGLFAAFTGPFISAWNWIDRNIVQPAKAFFAWLAGKQSSNPGDPFTYGGGSRRSYDIGGLIPGVGPVPITAHGGEYVLTRGDTGLMRQLITAINKRDVLSGISARFAGSLSAAGSYARGNADSQRPISITIDSITINGGRAEAEEALGVFTSGLTTRLQALGAIR